MGQLHLGRDLVLQEDNHLCVMFTILHPQKPSPPAKRHKMLMGNLLYPLFNSQTQLPKVFA